MSPPTPLHPHRVRSSSSFASPAPFVCAPHLPHAVPRAGIDTSLPRRRRLSHRRPRHLPMLLSERRDLGDHPPWRVIINSCPAISERLHPVGMWGRHLRRRRRRALAAGRPHAAANTRPASNSPVATASSHQSERYFIAVPVERTVEPRRVANGVERILDRPIDLLDRGARPHLLRLHDGAEPG